MKNYMEIENGTVTGIHSEHGIDDYMLVNLMLANLTEGMCEEKVVDVLYEIIKTQSKQLGIETRTLAWDIYDKDCNMWAEYCQELLRKYAK